jgi:hypothetical protein
MTGGNNDAQIIAPSPKIGGGLYRAPLGTTLPTDTTTSLNVAFISLGYVDDDGVTVNIDRPSRRCASKRRSPSANWRANGS